MRRKRLKAVFKALERVGGPLVVLGVVVGFLAFVIWDFQHQRKKEAASLVGHLNGGAAEGDAGSDGVAAAEAEPVADAEEAEMKLLAQEEEPPEATGPTIPYDALRDVRVEVLVEGLSSPDGLALDEESGALFVSEEDLGEIWRFHEGRRTRAVGPDTPIHRPGSGQPDAPARGLEGIALSGNDRLYAVEDLPGGRLLAFHLDEQGTATKGEVIPIPGLWSDFAWESVAVHPDGRILLAGSNLEQAQNPAGLGVFVGVLLFRDAAGNWWIPYERLFGSFSAVSFSKSGGQAVYTCEVSGEIGWIDLRSSRPMGGTSQMVATSPEGVAVLPDGGLLVAEEGGTLLVLDPGTDHMQRLVEGLPALESVLWDAERKRILAVDDAKGRVLSLYPEPGFSDEEDRMEYALYRPIYNLVHVPERCPPYLAGVLALGGLDYGSYITPAISFRDFTQRIPLIAADARVEPLKDTAMAADPIEHLQLVVFEPNQIINAERGPSPSLAGFYARTRSGRVIQTSTMRLLTRMASIPELDFEGVGDVDLVIPNASSVHVSAAGIATLYFLGFGRTPDFSITLNPLHPESSRMIVEELDGARHTYRLLLPGVRANANDWVVAYARQIADRWKALGNVYSMTAPERNL